MNSTTITTPAGPLTIVATPDGVVRAAGFTGDPGELLAGPTVRYPDLGEITAAVHAYLDGELTAIDDVPVEQPGGEFLSQVWRTLRQTKPGERVSYTELAARTGRPTAVRAAATGCARNAAALFVPCHRAVRADGGLSGYRWGIDAKRWLLAHEQGHQA